MVLAALALLVLAYVAPIQYLYMSSKNELAVQSAIRAARSECEQKLSGGIEVEFPSKESNNECCVQCTTPKGKCCLFCSDRASPREHDLLMAAMEGLTHYVMESFKGSYGFLKNRAWQGNSHIGNRPVQATFYYDWIRSLHDVKHVCEIGMNGGHSAVIFLAALHLSQNKTSMVHLDMFDLSKFKYSKAVETYIKVLYPRMFTLHVGNSRSAVPRWIEDNAKNNGLPCDIFSVDGDHTYEGALVDIKNAANATKKGGYIILDDMSPDGPTRKAFDEVVRDGILDEVKCVENLYTRTGYDNRLDETNARELMLSFCTAKVV